MQTSLPEFFSLFALEALATPMESETTVIATRCHPRGTKRKSPARVVGKHTSDIDTSIYVERLECFFQNPFLERPAAAIGLAID